MEPFVLGVPMRVSKLGGVKYRHNNNILPICNVFLHEEKSPSHGRDGETSGYPILLKTRFVSLS